MKPQKKIIFIAILMIEFMLIGWKFYSDRQQCQAAEANIWDGSIATEFSAGDGTQINPYVISDGSELALLAQKVNENDEKYNKSYYCLTNDIILNDTTNWEQWDKQGPKNMWTPIGATELFQGVFDGNNHSVTGVYIKEIVPNYGINDVNEDELEMSIGLFGFASNASIMNLVVDESYIINRSYQMSGIVGALNEGTISNCTFGGRLLALDGSYQGGICGINNEGTIRNCTNKGIIEVETTDEYAFYIGGIVGRSTGKIIECTNLGTADCKDKSANGAIGGIVAISESDITACVNSGTINMPEIIGDYNLCYIGGIVGDYNGGTISESYNIGKIICGDNNNHIGGIAGQVYEAKINNCYNDGTISISSDCYNIGGIVGKNYTSQIIDCHNLNKISVKNECSNIGGIVGSDQIYSKNTLIRNCYNAGSIEGKKECRSVGGIAGNSKGKVENCYNKGGVIFGSDSHALGGIIGDTSKSKIKNCGNYSKITASSGSYIGGVVGDIGAFAIFNDDAPNVKPGIYNCFNRGEIGGKKCSYVGGIAGETYDKLYNCYNSGKVNGFYTVGPIISRLTYGMENACINCYYLKDCAKSYDSNEVNNYGTEMSKKEMQSKKFAETLNQWCEKQKSNTYSKWVYSKKKNGAYPYLVLS